jgi:putative aldouronate transport system substrate-binding protein
MTATRRDFLQLSAAGAAAGLLAACSVPLPSALSSVSAPSTPSAPSAAQPDSGAVKVAGVQLPAHVAASAKPDFAGTDAGVDPGYASFPKDPYQSVPEPPMQRGDVSGFVLTNATPKAFEQNLIWQSVSKALGGNLKLIFEPQADYAPKWAAMTASGDLPDLMYNTQVPILPNIPVFAKTWCADLTSYLSGDGVKEYPNLANFASASWKVPIKNGGIAGIPTVQPLTGPVLLVNQGLVDQANVGPLATVDDFKRLCQALSNPQNNRWAIGVTNDNTSGPYSMWIFQGMFRAPNNWRVEPDGKLVKDIETDEYRAALGYLRELVASGYVSPDLKTNADLNNDVLASKVAMRANSWPNYYGFGGQASVKARINIRAIPPLSADAKSKPGHLLSFGAFGFSLMKKATPDRIKELLRVLNYLAAPFGTQEYVLIHYGLPGTHYNLDSRGIPVLTDLGMADTAAFSQGVGYMARPPYVNFSADAPDLGKIAHDDQAAFVAAGIADPTVGQSSPTYEARGAQLEQMIFDRVSSIAAGRLPLSDLDQLVQDWRAQGGEQARGEYQKNMQ